MSKKVVFELSAFEDLQSWFRLDLQTYFRIINLLKQLENSSETIIQQSQPLKRILEGYYCFKINEKHRLVYKVTNREVIIASCRYY